ncbi:MAG: GHKL domain-containing protein [Lachnospiraceae bacterium]|nr:GHKL domain-containing protein [Lachnospiraceae bacterium]
MYTFLYLSLFSEFWLAISLFKQWKSRPNYNVLIVGTVLSVVADLLKIPYADGQILIAIIVASILIFVAFVQTYKGTLGIFIFCFATILAVNECIGIICSLLAKTISVFIYSHIISSIISIFLLMMIRGIIYIRLQSAEENTISNNKIFFFSGIFLVEIVAVVAGLEYAGKYVPSDGFVKFSLIISLLSLMGILIISYFIIYIKRFNDRLAEMLKREEELNRMQKIYYETIMKKNEDIRKFRHDIQNHYMCIKQMADGGEYEELSNYISQMQEELRCLNSGIYNTGNSVLDILLTYYCSKVPEGTKLVVDGKADLSLDEMKICTIFSNLLKNAVEELDKVADESGNEKEFTINMIKTGDYNTIKITNTAITKKDVDNLRTMKEEEGHGLGLKNVKKAVDDLRGRIDMESSDKRFSVMVTLPSSAIAK